MEQLNAILDKLQPLLNVQSTYLILLYKIIIVVIGTLLAWLILKRIFTTVEKRINKYEFIQINTQIFQIIRNAIFLGLMLVAGTYLIRLFNVPILEKIFQAFIIILLAGPAKDFIKIAIGYLQRSVADKTDNKVDDIIFELLSKFAGAIIYATAIIISLDSLGVNVIPFIAGAGVAGIAIGFAAKDTLSNLIAGVLLIIDRPFEVGDRIEVWSAPAGTSTWGDVIDIGLRATRIRTTDHLTIVIPNNEIMMRDIVNYTTISEKIRVRINIGVAYDADIQKTKELILGVAQTAKWIAAEPQPKVVVRNFGESSVDLQLRVWIGNARKRMDTISYITDKVKEVFDKEGVEIPYPKRDIYVHQIDMQK
jgi:small-conductance mechanosensitive channel